MSEAAFSPFPKMGRLTRTCIITEKIDGTNAQVLITTAYEAHIAGLDAFIIAKKVPVNTDGVWTQDEVMLAGSRTRYITPGKSSDNAGFAAWVAENATELFKLGPGRHFGEWWGKSIQCGYGLQERRFSLFNTLRWASLHTAEKSFVEGIQFAPACCHVVPTLYTGLFSDRVVDGMLEFLRARGSVAVPGWMKPEGVVIFHTATGTTFKKTIEGDESPKALHKAAQPVSQAAIDSEWARSET